MRHHKKTYEDVFSTDHKGNRNTIKLENVTTDIMGVGEYIKSFQEFLKDFYDDLFLKCVKLSWLRRKFIYNGSKSRMPVYTNTRMYTGKFTKFIRRYIGHDIQVITKGYFFSKLETFYFDTLFPGFMDGNPFENPDYYKFPYKNISLEYLTVVYQMDDRFEILEEADKQKMSYAVFLDYVINYILSENEVLGRDKYTLTQNKSRGFPYFVRDNDKQLIPLKGSKRI